MYTLFIANRVARMKFRKNQYKEMLYKKKKQKAPLEEQKKAAEIIMYKKTSVGSFK